MSWRPFPSNRSMSVKGLVMAEKKPASESEPGSSQFRNRLLSALSAEEFGLLQPYVTRVSLTMHQELEQPNREIQDIYFPESGIASVVAFQPSGTQVEVGPIGREGMTGIAILLGAGSSPHSCCIQVPGTAVHIRARELQLALERRKSLHDKLLRYVQVFMVQTAQTAITNALAKIDQRLARWLLMAHDRVDGNSLPLTHEFLGLMLAVRRAGVTEALHELASQGLIDTQRGEIVVLNREGLQRSAGERYGMPEAEYRRLLG
jgi:CRP-like cAMP-binding protein